MMAGPFQIGVDDDNDGATDCDDSDCDAEPACIEICNDNIDNDGVVFRTACCCSSCEREDGRTKRQSEAIPLSLRHQKPEPPSRC